MKTFIFLMLLSASSSAATCGLKDVNGAAFKRGGKVVFVKNFGEAKLGDTGTVLFVRSKVFLGDIIVDHNEVIVELKDKKTVKLDGCMGLYFIEVVK